MISPQIDLAKLLSDKEWNTCSINHEKNKIILYRTNNIEALSERLRYLKITNEASSRTNKQLDEEMSVAPAPAFTNDNIQAIIPKSMV